MAIFNPGPAVGQISGRIGGVVFSHNRGGMYIRNGTIPITSTTEAAINAKTRLANSSQAWQALTAAQRDAWQFWADANPVINRLGRSITLSGLSAYNMLNTRLTAAGLSAISVPPIIAPPPGLTSLVADGDIGAGDFDLTFTAAPLGTNARLWIRAAVTNSPARNYVQNLLRFVGVSGAAETSPYDCEAQVVARLGTLTVGQTVHFEVSVLDGTTGLLSNPLADSVIVTSTV